MATMGTKVVSSMPSIEWGSEIQRRHLEKVLDRTDYFRIFLFVTFTRFKIFQNISSEFFKTRKKLKTQVFAQCIV